jgi:hypothetical protein
MSDEQILQIIRDRFNNNPIMTEEHLILFLLFKQYDMQVALLDKLEEINSNIREMRSDQLNGT